MQRVDRELEMISHIRFTWATRRRPDAAAAAAAARGGRQDQNSEARCCFFAAPVPLYRIEPTRGIANR